jgi:hypothetical protein
MQDLGSSSYTKYYIGRDMLTVSNDSVARYRPRVWCCDVHGECKSNVSGFTVLAKLPQRLNVFNSNVFRCIENLVLRFSDQTGMQLRGLLSLAHASSLAGTLKPGKVSDAFDIGPPVVKRVIAIDNAALRQQFISTMDRMEAKGASSATQGGAWDCDDALRVLRMSIPDIQQCAPCHAASFAPATFLAATFPAAALTAVSAGTVTRGLPSFSTPRTTIARGAFAVWGFARNSLRRRAECLG